MPSYALLTNATTTGPGTTLDCVSANKASISVVCSNTDSGTTDVLFEATVDGTNWFPYSGTLIGTKQVVDRVSASRAVYFDVEPIASIRPNIKTLAKGSVSATGYLETGKGQTAKSYAHFNATTAGTLVKTGNGILGRVIIGDAGSAMVVTIYDGTSTAGNVVAVLKVAGSFEFNVEFATGLFVVIAATTPGDVSIEYS